MLNQMLRAERDIVLEYKQKEQHRMSREDAVKRTTAMLIERQHRCEIEQAELEKQKSAWDTQRSNLVTIAVRVFCLSSCYSLFLLPHLSLSLSLYVFHAHRSRSGWPPVTRANA